jgi:hypothetical protein
VLRQQFWKYYDKTSAYYPMLDKNHKRDSVYDFNDSLLQFTSFNKFSANEHTIPFKTKKPTIGNYTNSVPGSFKTFF